MSFLSEGGGDAPYPHTEEESDSEDEKEDEEKKANLRIDDWIQFNTDPEVSFISVHTQT